MLRRTAKISLLLAVVVALRALVPIGYMLHAPATDGGLGAKLALTFCPTQNPHLALDQLASIGEGGATHSHGPEHSGEPSHDTGSVIDASSDCAAWLSSLSIQVSTGDAKPSIPQGVMLVVRLTAQPGPNSRFNHRPAVRAPPLTV